MTSKRKGDAGPDLNEPNPTEIQLSNKDEIFEKWLPNHPTPRLRLRFADLIGKTPPVGMIFLDEALNMLGRETFPDSWGMTTVWKQQPFRSESENRDFHRYRQRRTENSGWRIERAKIGGLYNPLDLQSAASIYEKVVTDFRGSAEKAKFISQYSDKDDSLKSIGATRWSSNLLTIFYTGYLFQGRAQDKMCAVRRMPILIQNESFQAWLETRLGKEARKSAAASLKRMASTLAQMAEKEQLKYTKSWLWEAVQEVVKSKNIELSESQFNTTIWKSPELNPHHAPPGKPTRQQQELLAKHEAEVKASVTRCIPPTKLI